MNYNYKQKLSLYAKLVRLDKPIGIYLLLWPTLWALFLVAKGFPDLTVLLVFIFGVIMMRSAGCAINDFADRDIDQYVERTKNRPLASGEISGKEALLVFAILSMLAFIVAFIFLNTLTIQFSLVAVLLAASYPFMKRFHYLPQVHLGMAFAWAVPMAAVALTNQLPASWVWLLFLATVLWTTAYDTIYGIIDREDDIKIGVKSTAILFGTADRLIVLVLQALFFVSLVLLGYQLELRYWYFLALILVCILFIYQYKLTKDYHRNLCLKAFLHNNYVGMVIFIGIICSYWLPV